MPSPEVELADVRHAAQELKPFVHRTPLPGSRTLDRLSGAHVRLKLENLQKTGSFKPRGALHHLMRLERARLAGGVVTVSAGNHAQATAFAAQRLGVAATVVMMQGASQAKLDATRAYGAHVEIVPDAVAGFERARELQAERGYYFVHPFDHPWTVAGAGTVGLEIFEDAPETEVVLVGVGGGGLISGTALALKELNPAVEVVGVEPEGADCMTRALAAGHVVRMDSLRTVADGLAAPFAGEMNLALARKYVDRVVRVGDEDILRASRLLLERCKLMAEPAGAAAVAALLGARDGSLAGRRCVAVVSGGNVSREVLLKILDA